MDHPKRLPRARRHAVLIASSDVPAAARRREKQKEPHPYGTKSSVLPPTLPAFRWTFIRRRTHMSVSSAHEADYPRRLTTLERCKGRHSADSSPAARDERIGRAFVRLAPSGGSLSKRISLFSSCPDESGRAIYADIIAKPRSFCNTSFPLRRKFIELRMEKLTLRPMRSTMN